MHIVENQEAPGSRLAGQVCGALDCILVVAVWPFAPW